MITGKANLIHLWYRGSRWFTMNLTSEVTNLFHSLTLVHGYRSPVRILRMSSRLWGALWRLWQEHPVWTEGIHRMSYIVTEGLGKLSPFAWGDGTASECTARAWAKDTKSTLGMSWTVPLLVADWSVFNQWADFSQSVNLQWRGR